jgi:hypothetical protein
LVSYELDRLGGDGLNPINPRPIMNRRAHIREKATAIDTTATILNYPFDLECLPSRQSDRETILTMPHCIADIKEVF